MLLFSALALLRRASVLHIRRKHLALGSGFITCSTTKSFRPNPKIVEGRFKRYGNFEYDTEGEIIRYKVLTSPRLNLWPQYPSRPLLND